MLIALAVDGDFKATFLFLIYIFCLSFFKKIPTTASRIKEKYVQ